MEDLKNPEVLGFEFKLFILNEGQSTVFFYPKNPSQTNLLETFCKNNYGDDKMFFTYETDHNLEKASKEAQENFKQAAQEIKDFKFTISKEDNRYKTIIKARSSKAITEEILTQAMTEQINLLLKAQEKYQNQDLPLYCSNDNYDVGEDSDSYKPLLGGNQAKNTLAKKLQENDNNNNKKNRNSCNPF